MILDTLQSLDASALESFRSLVDQESAWQVRLIHLFADVEVFVTVLVLVGGWLRARFLLKNDPSAKDDVLALFFAIVFAFGLYWLLNLGLPVRPRPETATTIPPLINHLPDNSFPSGHGIFAGASFLAAYFVYEKKTLAYALLALGIPMLAARVLAGVHYPGDVVVGFLLGASFASIAVRWLAKPSVRKSPLFTVPKRIASFVGL